MESFKTGKQDSQKNAKEENLHTLQRLHESVEVARATVNQLSLQSESLERTEDMVDDSQYMVDRSRHIVRGMTWKGWFYNMLVNAPQPNEGNSQNSFHLKIDSENEVISMGFICPECKQKFSSPENLTLHFQQEHENELDIEKNTELDMKAKFNERQSFKKNPPPAPLLRNGIKTEDSASSMRAGIRNDEGLSQEQLIFLESLEPQLAELKNIGKVMGNALETHNKLLERIDQKAERATDEMKQVTVQAARITNRKMKSVDFQFRVAFQEEITKRYLQVVNGQPIISAQIISDNATFRAYTIVGSPEIWGFQNEKSRDFLGLNRYGAVRVQGKKLRSYEQFAIENQRLLTTLYSFASYFGSGGWVVMDSSGRLSCISGSAANKLKAVRFKLVHLDEMDMSGKSKD